MNHQYPKSSKVKLPFGLKVKPIPHYFKNGVIRFTIKEGKLYFTLKVITKTDNFPIYKLKEIDNKEYLHKLQNVQNWNEIPLLTEVVS